MATILEKIKAFENRYGMEITVNNVHSRYFMLGAGSPVFWLTGGLRRAALAFDALEAMAKEHLVIAPDYPPFQHINDFMQYFDAILLQENINTFVLAGQSYGGLLAQAYLAKSPQRVKAIILSSSGPADYGRVWIITDLVAEGLARVLPTQQVKSLMARRIFKLVGPAGGEGEEWLAVIRDIFDHQLTRADVISHFAVAGDLIRKRIVKPSAFSGWQGRVVSLSAENDPTQSRADISRYERLFRRPVQLVSLGDMGHAAVMFNPVEYAALFEQAVGG